MMAEYDVLEKGWIPVITLEGDHRMYGVRKVLKEAHLLREISSASPMEEYSLYRFLCVFLMDALRPESELDIEDLLEEKALDEDKIEEYISLCKEEGVSFDLFDDETPFLQSRYDPKYEKEVKPVSVLDCTLPSGNNHTHFVHQRAVASVLDAGNALRKILATYLFCTAAAQGYPSGVNASPPYYGVIKGGNLFETLVYLMIPADLIQLELDHPPVLWRWKEEIEPKKTVGKTSWLAGMLFPTRRIHLIPDENGNVEGVYYCQGENFINKESWKDPHVSYRHNDNGYFPMRPSADRAIWRNFCDVINISGGQASIALAVYRSLNCSDFADMTLYGVETSQASYLGVYRHSLSFPLKLTEDDSYIGILKQSIEMSERLAKDLRAALAGIAVDSFGRLPDASITLAMQQYYRMCEDRFWSLCRALPEDEHLKQSYIDFCSDVGAYTKEVFQTATKGLNLRAALLAKAAKQQEFLNKRIIEMKKEASL